MINTLTNDFDSFIKEISLNQKEIDDIIEKHNNLTTMLKKEPPKGYKILKTRLSGSYAKHTVLNEYDKSKLPDVDIVIIIESNKKSVDEINRDFLNYFKIKKGKVVSEIRQQSNSISLIYSNISVDIVIAVFDGENLKITSHKMHNWILSNCIKHIEYMTKRNNEYEGFSYYDLMKLFKFLNKEKINNKIKSYTLEQLVHMCAPKNRVGLRLYQAFSETLLNISNIESISNIRDCCDNNKKGYDDKDTLNFKLFIYEINKYAKLSRKALAGDRKQWNEIFGEKFPIQTHNIVKNKGQYDKKQTPWCY